MTDKEKYDELIADLDSLMNLIVDANPHLKRELFPAAYRIEAHLEEMRNAAIEREGIRKAARETAEAVRLDAIEAAKEVCS